jgi:TolB-like protein/Tfp pilus assembly protein PilF
MSFFEELKRRNVFRVGIAYAIVAWLVLQLSDILVPLLNLPESVQRFILLLLVIGFFPALIFAWAFEMTPDGIKKEKDIDRSQSIVSQTGRKLDRAIIVILVLALGYFAYDKFLATPVAENKQASEQTAAVVEPVDEVGPAEKSIAVLPFTTRSTSEDDQFFSDGMHDDLLTQLAKIGSLKVISRTSVMEYRDTAKNLRQIGDELGVANILEGAVQRAGSTIRINMQLIDADTDEHLWAETYDRELSVDNLLAIQSEIARAITDQLQATLSPEEQVDIERKLTGNLEAMAAYRNAKVLSHFFIAEDLQRAEDEIRHALELDPKFAAAWAQLAYIYMSRYWGVDRDDNHRISAREAIDKGRAISPELLELDIAEGYYHYWGFRNYAEALSVLEPILKAYPNDFEILKVLAWVNRRHGNIDTSIEYMKRGLVLAPRDRELLYSLGETYNAMRDFEQTQIYLDRLLAVDPTTARGYQLQANQAAGRDDDFKSAARLLNLADDLDFLAIDAWEHHLLAGEYDKAMVAAKALEEEDDIKGLLSGWTLWAAGKTETARPLLEQARQGLLVSVEEEPNNFNDLLALCGAVGALQEVETSLTYCEAAMKALPNDAFSRSFWLKSVAGGLAMGGHHEKALDLIEAIFEARIGPSYNHVRRDPEFRSLHDTERWQRLFKDQGTKP